MIGKFLERWRASRARWKADARRLIAIDKVTAFHAAQVEIMRARKAGDRAEAWHWAKVAAEVARICPEADLDADRCRAAIRDASLDY